MNPLETLMWPLASLVNRQLRNKTPARELCTELEGKVVAVRVSDTALAIYFVVGPDGLDIRSYAEDPDVVISASLLALTRLAGQSADAAIRDGSIELSGDAETAQSFQRLLAFGKPDLEEELSSVFGDAVAHGLGDVARNVSRWGKNAHETVRQNVREYLQEESRTLPSRYEADAFRQQAETLRDDVERFEARLRRLENSGPDTATD